MNNIKEKQFELDLFTITKKVDENQDNKYECNKIEGLVYIPNFITQEEHEFILEQVDQQPWLSELKRRVQHYGYRYNYKSRKVDTSMKIGDLPEWMLVIAHKLKDDGLFSEIPDQIIVNEYLPGQGISKHIDCINCFLDPIISLSLGSTCMMNFVEKKTNNKQSLFLEPRSLVIFKDDARYKWTHAIPARKSDINQGHKIMRQRRISLTFRKVILLD